MGHRGESFPASGYDPLLAWRNVWQWTAYRCTRTPDGSRMQALLHKTRKDLAHHMILRTGGRGRMAATRSLRRRYSSRYIVGTRAKVEFLQAPIISGSST